jgi:hypothetical protein
MKEKFNQYVLFTNGVVDIFAAFALFFPLLGISLPGYSSYTSELAFVSGGWAIAALTFGIGRIWTSYRPEFYRVMVALGLFEGVTLSLFCLVNVYFLGISLLQAMLPLAVGGIYGALYLIAFAKA